MKPFLLLLSLPFLLACSGSRNQENVFQEQNGFLLVEAEAFHAQELSEIRQWYRIDQSQQPGLTPDPDSSHASSASGGAYLEILPDTRTNHDEQLIKGENFSNEPGKLGVLQYRVRFETAGKYYVWVKAFSTGTEDNGIHVGLNGEWPESGQRMQWCEGKNQWAWASKQRTLEVHCGVEQLIFLEIPTPGLHTIAFSMREDGFEFDQWAMSQGYEEPKD